MKSCGVKNGRMQNCGVVEKRAVKTVVERRVKERISCRVDSQRVDRGNLTTIGGNA